MTDKKQAKNDQQTGNGSPNNFTNEFKSDWILKNQKLSHYWAQKYARSYEMMDHLEDMIQAGMEGLINGINKFDPTKGKAKLSTVCSFWARAAIQKYIKTHRYSISIPATSKTQPSFTEVEENSISTEDISLHIEEEDSRSQHNLYDYLKVLTPLQIECFKYANNLTDHIDPRVIPLVGIMENIATIKLKHFFKINN